MSGTARTIGDLRADTFEIDFIQTLESRTPRFRSTDPEFGAAGVGASIPIVTLPTFAGVSTPAQLASVSLGGNTPYVWAANPAYGLAFTKTTSALTSSGNVLSFSNIAGDLTNPMQFLVLGMGVSGPNIPSGAIILDINFTSSTPNAIDGPLAGTIVLSANVLGTVASGATISFTYTPSMIQALQVDWLGEQAAEYAAGLTNSGGIHWSPAGSFIMSRPILRSDTPIGQVNTHQSLWMGDGKVGTQLFWPNDLGPGVWAITPLNRMNAGTNARSEIRNIGLVGPNAGSAMGVAACAMHGLALSKNAQVQDVSSQAFYSGINIIGDHHKLRECIIQNNFYNLYWGPLNGQTTGNSIVRDCQLDGTTMASVGVAGTNQIVTALFSGNHMGFGPYAFLKETGAVTNFLINSKLDRVSMEACGNGAIVDTNPSGLISGLVASSFDMALDMTNAYEDTSRGSYAMIYPGNMNSSTFNGEANPYTSGYNRASHPLSVAIIAAQQSLAKCHFGNATSLISAGSPSFPAVAANFAMLGDDITFDAGSARGVFRTTYPTAIASGTFVSLTDFGLAIPQSAANSAIVGLAAHGTSGAIPAGAIPLITDGFGVAAKHTATDVIAAGNYVQVSAGFDGKVSPFNASARTTVVGVTWHGTASGDTTVELSVSIKGP